MFGIGIAKRLIRDVEGLERLSDREEKEGKGTLMRRSSSELINRLVDARVAKELAQLQSDQSAGWDVAGYDAAGWDVAGWDLAGQDSAGALFHRQRQRPGHPTSSRHAAHLMRQLGRQPGGFLPPGAEMARTDRNPVGGIPFEATDPTVLTLIPVTNVLAGAALLSTTFPPNLFFAADLIIDTFGGSFQVDLYTIGGVPVIQGNGAYSASLHGPASFNNPPLRRIIETSQPIQLNITNRGALASLVSAYIPGYLCRGVMSNY